MLKQQLKSIIATTLLVLGSIVAGTVSANLIYDGPNTASGTGLGSVDTLTTAHDPGGSGDKNGTESSCVEFDGISTVESPCHFLAGEQGGDNEAINQTFTLTDLGSSSAGDLALVVNVAEPGNDKTVILTGLYLSIYNEGATQYFYYVGPDLTLNQDNQSPNGTGQAGFLFSLDAVQAATANAFCLTGTCVIGGGVQFQAGSTDNGNETLYVTSLPNGPPSGDQPLPEPGVLALVAASLIAAFASKRIRRSK